MIYATSDTHFTHNNIIKYCGNSRPFSNVEDMNEKIIENWNSVVTDKDTVIHCGDFFMGKIDTIEPILRKLNFGALYLVIGNHDTKNRLREIERIVDNVVIIDYFILYYNKRNYVFNHYPLDDTCEKEGFLTAKEFFEDNVDDSIYCYGHTHQEEPVINNHTYNVGIDANGLKPVSLDYILKMAG